MDLLKQLYWIHAPSGSEYGIQGFIRGWLYKHGINFSIDDNNQTYFFNNPKQPVLCAHADQVDHEPLTRLIETSDIIRGDSNLGADDKNGVWIVLNLLKENPDLNFCFSNEEEIGGLIQGLLYQEEDLLKDIPYCLVFDRKGGGDIIGVDNNYCTEEFQDDIAAIGNMYGYTPTQGVWSDCDSIAGYINCVNISCGYHNAHTDKEYTNKKEILNALNFGKEIINTLTKMYQVEQFKSSYSYEDMCPNCGGILNNYYDDELDCIHCGKVYMYDMDYGLVDLV